MTPVVYIDHALPVVVEGNVAKNVLVEFLGTSTATVATVEVVAGQVLASVVTLCNEIEKERVVAFILVTVIENKPVPEVRLTFVHT
jgi:hypothetical protein